MHPGIRRVAERFALDGDLVSAERHVQGHINETWILSCSTGSARKRYVLQRINETVFADPRALMQNVATVTAHLAAKQSNVEQVLELVPSNDNDAYVKDQGFWRTYKYIENTFAVDAVENPTQAYKAAEAFGRFHRLIADLPPVVEIIPGFHDTPARIRQLEDAAHADVVGRTASCKNEIDYLLSYTEQAGELMQLLASREVPLRNVHNDTKINNVLFDRDTGDAVCVIDLDTVMPGTILFDFGDMVRSAAGTAAEDAANTSNMHVDIEIFEALIRGFVAGAGSIFVPAEIEHLAISGRTITMECAMRFLTDYLQGDSYFRVNDAEHNLRRCQAQMALAHDIDQNLSTLKAIVAKACT